MTSRKKLLEEIIPALKEKKSPAKKLKAIMDAFAQYRELLKRR